MSGIRLSSLMRQLRRAGPSGDGPDPDLLARFVQGDDAAFELLVWRHGAIVMGACRRVLGNTEDAEDAFQATFLVLARKAGSVSRGVTLPAWLHRVAVRLATRLARSRRSTKPLTVDPPCPTTPDPVERADESAVLDEEIDRLPERCRRAVVLCYFEGLTAAEAGRQLGCPTGTVESRLAAARARLRDRLTRRGVTLPVGVLAVVSARVGLAPGSIARTVRAAVAFAREGAVAAAGVVGQPAVGLTQGVLAMDRTRWWFGGFVATAVAVSAGVVWANRAAPAAVAEDPPPAKATQVATGPPAAVPPKAKDEPPARAEAWPLAREAETYGTLRQISADGKFLILSTGHSAKRYDLATNTSEDVESSNDILDVALSADGKRIATVEKGNGVKLRDSATSKVLEAFWPSAGIPARQVAFGADGSRLIALCRRSVTVASTGRGLEPSTPETTRHEFQIAVWDLTTQKELGWPAVTWTGSARAAPEVSLAAGGRFVLKTENRVKQSPDGVQYGGYRFTLIDPVTGVAGKPTEYWGPGSPTDTDCGLSPDGKTLLAINGDEAIVIDLTTGRERLRLGRTKMPIAALAYSADGKRIAAATGWPSGDNQEEVAAATEVVIWDAATGRESARMFDKESNRNFRSIRFSPDGSYLATQYEVWMRSGPNSRTLNPMFAFWGRPPVSQAPPPGSPLRPGPNGPPTPLQPYASSPPVPLGNSPPPPTAPSESPNHVSPAPAASDGVPNRFQSLIRELSAGGIEDRRRVEGVFAAALGRLPTEIEARTLATQVGRQADKAAALRDLLATLIDTPEFRAHAAALQQLAKPTPPLVPGGDSGPAYRKREEKE
ncbi:sigma-70 family RNA polymerase sigma factor [Fimbriiglobus ruber]|uniref:RNA polymerase sigma-70 factor n=1 Tax=Fimbriiglobus ruber TaxID=1908690 RepID=A0A225DW04_9BACT|nr:sigma-70 family RNA polymerase sigma factor [Fimbriiglobus ruber]OWK45562.1 RNA polymerase sigma-70 factor [Fimbriiglobus ruber]